jgi:hypothetical protein
MFLNNYFRIWKFGIEFEMDKENFKVKSKKINVKD